MPGRYRRTGADPPFAQPVGYHGAGMEGWFWRFTEPAGGTVAVALLAISRDARGRSWAMAALALHPGGHVRSAALAEPRADPRSLRVRAGGGAGAPSLEADADGVRIDLGPDARLEATFEAPRRWPRRVFGGIGPAQAVPGLSQYWHPHLLHARARGSVRVGAGAAALDGASAYAEKNWGPGGHPPLWWWGQAHAFDSDPEGCAAFAGGRAAVGRVPVTATAVVVAAGGEVVRLVRPPAALRVDVGAGGWRIRGRTPRHALVVEGAAGAVAPHRLPVPAPLERRALEGFSAMHLAGELRVTLRRGRRTVLDATSRLAGLERGTGPTAARRAAPPD